MDTRIRSPTERRHKKPLKRLNRPFRYHRTLHRSTSWGARKGALSAALDGLQSPFWPLWRM